MKKLGCLCITVLFFLGCFGFMRFFLDNNSDKNYSFKENIVMPSVDALNRFSEGLKIKTISNPDYQNTDFEEFDKFINYIQTAYPEIFAKCEFKLVNKYGIVLKLQGKNKENLPNILTAHYDVVGVKNEANWKYPAFSGYFDKEYFYSRGVLDDKGSLFAILEALKDLINQGFEPQSGLYIAFSQTEETGSSEGAPKIIEEFEKDNIRFNTVLDEGGRITDKNNRLYALIGTGEKGRLLTKITVYGTASHASKPDKNAAVYKAAKIIDEFSKNDKKAIVSKETEKYYKTTYKSYSRLTRFLISNMDILKPLFIWKISDNPEDRARISSTFAVTVVEASNVQNAVSSDASILIDSRILPDESTDDIKNYIEKKIKKALPDEKVKIEYLSEIEPSKSSLNSDEFEKLSKIIRKIYPDIMVSPCLTLGGTDAREYSKISDSTFRFLPCILKDEEAGLMHGDNEKLSVKNWARMITFYKEYILTK